jgi:hypothetical protein
MIPQRNLRNESAGSEIRERVTACRKRLRSNRYAQKAPVDCDYEEDSSVPSAAFLDGPPGMRESLLSIELSSAALDGGNDTHDMLLTRRTQEVGIT